MPSGGGVGLCVRVRCCLCFRFNLCLRVCGCIIGGLGIGVVLLLLVGVGVFVRQSDVCGHRLGGFDDTCRPFGVNLRKRAQKEAADVGENGGAAGGDAGLCQKLGEVHEGIVGALCSLKKLAPCGQVPGMIGG